VDTDGHSALISGIMLCMAASTVHIDEMILTQLASGDRRVLSLVVSIRNVLNRSGSVKGDLSSMVKSALRKLVAAGTVVDEDGVYSLTSVKQPQA